MNTYDRTLILFEELKESNIERHMNLNQLNAFIQDWDKATARLRSVRGLETCVLVPKRKRGANAV